MDGDLPSDHTGLLDQAATLARHRRIEMPPRDAHAYGAEVMTRNMPSHESAEGIDAVLSCREPVWSGT